MPLAKTLSAYLARQFLTWCGAVFAIMLTITFLLDYLELIRRSGARPEATLALLLAMAALKLPHMAQEVLPFGILFGTMLAFWRLTRTNELVVARSAGVSVWQFLTPAIMFALIIGVFAVTVFNPIASATQGLFESMESRVLRGSNDQFTLSRSGLWLRETDEAGNERMLHAERSANGDIALENVTILFFRSSDEGGVHVDQFSGRVDAKEAVLMPNRWEVLDGARWQQNGEQEPFAAMELPTYLTPRKIQDSFASPETMSFWELPGFIHLLEVSGFATQRHRLYFYALLARPFLLCAMVLLAATFSLRMQRRGGATMMIAGGVVTAFLLFFLSNFVFALGLSATVPVVLAAWTPAGIAMLLGVTLLLHLEDG
ncbi:MAG: LPS export ABC transporter permease LptG [Alphaproteobacteria bacterium]|nr:LPS export ABC transporter permease LptG [Alphaproteobacteria bacterium]